MTALHVAANYKHKEVVGLLLDQGADKNAADFQQYTPLHLAANYDNEEVVRLLLANGADKNLKDSGGRTPYDLAKKSAIQALLK